jgi:FkbM family methyltransferase
MYGEFEVTEVRLLQKFLHPGMTVMDVGAHHGWYTLLASKHVGKRGKVIAFEPSPRECRRLEKHLRFNRCSNVHLERCAAGSEPGEADLFLVDGFQDWCT